MLQFKLYNAGSLRGFIKHALTRAVEILGIRLHSVKGEVYRVSINKVLCCKKVSHVQQILIKFIWSC